MKKIIIVRYCEIHLKGKNRGFFERLLFKNIALALNDIEHTQRHINTRYLIENFKDCDLDIIIEKLQKVCGVHSMSVAYSVPTSYENILECSAFLIKEKSGDFKVEANRADKTFPINSLQLMAKLGGDLLDINSKLVVNVKKPTFTVNVDIRESGETLIFTDIIKGVSGMPASSAGHGMLMISGGIDSPVAGFMMAKRGMKLSAVHFYSYPYTSEQAKEKVIELSKLVSEYSAGIDLYLVKFTKAQEMIHERCPEELMITMMRRLMMRIAEKLSKKCGAQTIITGESLGQVASQTIESITSSNSVVTLPVLRPLIGFDKLEIIEIAQKIGTYDTSILPYEDCCTVFLPKFPAIKPKMEVILRAESKLDVDAIVNECVDTVEVFSL